MNAKISTKRKKRMLNDSVRISDKNWFNRPNFSLRKHVIILRLFSPNKAIDQWLKEFFYHSGLQKTY